MVEVGGHVLTADLRCVVPEDPARHALGERGEGRAGDSWDLEGTDYDQEEWFFLVRTSMFEPASTGWTDTESATLRGHRWWSLEDLRTTNETVFPEDLASQLERLLAA